MAGGKVVSIQEAELEMRGRACMAEVQSSLNKHRCRIVFREIHEDGVLVSKDFNIVPIVETGIVKGNG